MRGGQSSCELSSALRQSKAKLEKSISAVSELAASERSASVEVVAELSFRLTATSGGRIAQA